MSLCGENIVRMIDKGLDANRQEGICRCGWKDRIFVKCNNCIIRDALMISRSCIKLTVQRIDVLKSTVGMGQGEIKEKLKKLIKKEGVRDD